MAKDNIEFYTTMYPFFYPESCCDGKKEKKHCGLNQRNLFNIFCLAVTLGTISSEMDYK